MKVVISRIWRREVEEMGLPCYKWNYFTGHRLDFTINTSWRGCLWGMGKVGGLLVGGGGICGESKVGKRWVRKDNWCRRRELCTRVKFYILIPPPVALIISLIISSDLFFTIVYQEAVVK